MTNREPARSMRFASALAMPPEADALAQSLLQPLEGGPVDLVLLFLAGLDLDAGLALTERLRQALQPRVFLACTAEGVIGAETEVEEQPAASAIAARLPGVELIPFDVTPAQWPHVLDDPAEFGRAFNFPPDSRLVFFLADPFTTPIDAVLAAFNQRRPGLPLAGGLASGAPRPGYNLVIRDERVLNGGAVGVALAGAVDVDIVVSQGCRPVGPAFVVTAAENNLIYSLAHESPVAQIQNLYADLTAEEQQLLQNGLFIGRALPAEADAEEDLGRGDFLVRGVLGVERQTGALAVGDQVAAGETIQFHVRDAATAQEDLELLLTPHTFGEPPAGAVLFSCNGRGTRLFDHPNGDISVITAALGVRPLAGFFCAGELGPVRGHNCLHGQTASLVLLRPRSA
ncbi:MAG: FIST C-terminal domain-containing protein [Anaerolineales bacterium]|nr:FIST C-terminal domain-containing protein [Anaerolineales bacterium]